MTIFSRWGRLALAVALAGALGCEGEQGPAGMDGMDGTDGTDGVNGRDGTDGTDGTNGMDGRDGTDGQDGVDGTDAPGGGGIFLNLIGRYSTGIFDESAAEIVTYDPSTERLYFINANDATVDVLDISDPTTPTLVTSLDPASDVTGSTLGGATSCAVANGVLAVAVSADPQTNPGVVAFYDTSDNSFTGSVTVGNLPDNVAFTPDGNTVITADEGEPDDGIDPDGSVSIVDVAGLTARTATFTSFNADEAALVDAGVRIIGNGDGDTTVAQDLEPEYVTTDGTLAWVTCQENNALAIVDIATATVVDILPLGTKDHTFPGNELDVSDRDDRINIRNWPIVGMYQPDAITYYEANGTPYLLTANEGDARGFEEERIDDIMLDPLAYPDPLGDLERMEVTTATGDLDDDGDIDLIHAYGARSFSIWNGLTGELVFDSGNDFEVITATRLGTRGFNATNDENEFDGRSDAKGPEPEAVTVGVVDGVPYAFIGLERVGGVMAYDISHPESPRFVTYVNPRDFSVEDVETDLDDVGDLGPESIVFISAEDSPTGQILLAVGNEVSGTVAIFEVATAR